MISLPPPREKSKVPPPPPSRPSLPPTSTKVPPPPPSRPSLPHTSTKILPPPPPPSRPTHPTKKDVEAARKRQKEMIKAREKASNLMKQGSLTKDEFENMWFVKEESELNHFFNLAKVRVSMDETGEIMDFDIDELMFLDPDGPRSFVAAPLDNSEIDMIWGNWNELMVCFVFTHISFITHTFTHVCIQLLHKQFLNELRPLIAMDVSISQVLIAEKIIDHVRRLRKPLGSYTAHMIHVTPFVRSKLKSNALFRRFCIERQKVDESDGLPIDSTLIVPVQRPSRYLLLLREMSKNISAKDRDKLKSAIDELNDLNSYFDICVSRERVVSLEMKIGEPWLKLAVKGREYIMDGRLKKTQDGIFHMESSHERHFYLMSDCFFYTKETEIKGRLKEKPQGLMYLKHLKVKGKDDDYEHGIELTCFDKKWTLYASNRPEHNAWLGNIKRVMESGDLTCLPCMDEGYKGVSFKVYGLSAR